METTQTKRYGKSDWRRLLATRRGTVLVALACTLVAGGILIFAMARYRSSVDAGGNPETVLVATQAIPKGTPGDTIASQNLFKPTQIVARQVSAGAIADTGLLHGQVTAKAINPGEQLTTADFTTDGGLPAQLQPNERAMTLTLDPEHGMIGNISAGDHVDVYAGINTTGQAGRAQGVEGLLIPNVPVLRTGSVGAVGVSSNGNTAQVTLNIPYRDAPALAYAADNGKVWLVLRPANAVGSPPPPVVAVASQLFGSTPQSTGGK
jgi:Flp pilus assembly protein CpaB